MSYQIYYYALKRMYYKISLHNVYKSQVLQGGGGGGGGGGGVEVLKARVPNPS